MPRKLSPHKKRIRVGILGASGRMGEKLKELILSDGEFQNDFVLSFLCSGPQDPRRKEFAQKLPDVLIDFSAPAATLALAPLCKKHKVPFLVCTTGFKPTEISKLKKLLEGSTWAFVPNTSIGIFALKRALRSVLEILPENSFQIEIVEAHHKHKKDSPSGTAKLLAEEINHSGYQDKVAMHALRGGSETGEHQIHFFGSDERLTLSHHAQDRGLFARGALVLAKKLLSKKPRKHAYTVDDLFS